MPRGSAELSRQREARAWDLALKGKTERSIAVELAKAGLGTVSAPAVHQMLERVEKRILEELKGKTDHQKSRQTAALWKLYDEAMEAWERSKKPQKQMVSKHGPGNDDGRPGSVVESTSTIRENDGDPRYLAEARQILQDIRKIWGLDAPQKIAPTSPDGTKEYRL